MLTLYRLRIRLSNGTSHFEIVEGPSTSLALSTAISVRFACVPDLYPLVCSLKLKDNSFKRNTASLNGGAVYYDLISPSGLL